MQSSTLPRPGTMPKPSRRRRGLKRSLVPILTFSALTLWLLSYRFQSNPSSTGPIDMGNRPSVTLRQGTFVGDELIVGIPQVLEQFLGIPYAGSTEGYRRFEPPVPVEDSKEEFDASSYGDRCPNGPAGGIPQSEDCLNLNIYRPKERDLKKKLPVLVHIHGGSFNFGFGATRQISNMVAWSAEPMIGISFNYRLGAFGFLSSTWVKNEGSLNLGLQDQATLLQWVQDNIEEFGGDPGKVTIMGSSAGAHSVGHLLLFNTTTTPPFARAILESGAPTARAVYSYHNPMHEKQFQEFITYLGLEDVADELLMGELKSLPTSDIQAASEAVFYKYDSSVRWPWQPVIDGKGGMIAESPIDAWIADRFHKVAILTGYNTNEGNTFVPSDLTISSSFNAFFHTLLPSLWDADLTALSKLYPDPLTNPNSIYRETRPGLGKQYARLAAAYGQFAYIAPVRHTVHFAAQAAAPVYLYHFDVSTSEKGRSDHGVHNSFVTYNPEIRQISDTMDEISGSMHAYWTSFIVTGDPNTVQGRYPDRMKWPKYSLGEKERGSGRLDGRLLMFGEGNDEIAGGENEGVVVQVKDDGWVEKECDFWWKRVALFEL